MSQKEYRRKPKTTVFSNLKNKTLAELTSQDYDEIIKNAYIEESNIQMISDLTDVIKFQEKPKGLQLVKAVQTGPVNSTSWVTLLEIPAGKTFDIQVVTAVATTGDSTISYALDSLDYSGLKYLLKNVTFDGTDGVAVDFSTMGDFLISGQADQSTYLKAQRASGTGSVAAHNVFYREVN